MINYYKLFDLLVKHDMLLAYLGLVLQRESLDRIAKHEMIEVSELFKICELFDCMPNNIVEVV